MVRVLLLIWTFPQNLLGYIIIVLLKAHKSIDGSYHFSHLYIAPMCLGEIININIKMYPPHLKERYLLCHKHEQGHQIQSYYLGWLYLVIVGFPSITLNIFSRYHQGIRQYYFEYFPEKWADHLGKVKRPK